MRGENGRTAYSAGLGGGVGGTKGKHHGSSGRGIGGFISWNKNGKSGPSLNVTFSPGGGGQIEVALLV